MTIRSLLVVAVLIAISLTAPMPAFAQRGGFIIGLGLGPGVVSSKRTVEDFGLSDGDSKLGMAMSFHIGAVLGNSLELYLANHIVWHGNTTAYNASYVGTGFTGFGVTYPVNGRVSVKGGAGVGRSVAYFSNGSSLTDWDGPGLLAGGRYAVSDRWALDLDVIRGSWNSGGIPAETGTAWLLELEESHGNEQARADHSHAGEQCHDGHLERECHEHGTGMREADVDQGGCDVGRYVTPPEHQRAGRHSE
jgi:hypothetical protein